MNRIFVTMAVALAILVLANLARAGDIHGAAEIGDVEKVKALLKSNPAAASEKLAGAWNWTPLHFATAFGQKAVAELLLANNADINAKDSVGMTPIYWPIKTGKKDIVELLLSKKADVNAKDSSQWTPLHMAAIAGTTDIAKLLIDNKADISAKDDEGFTPLIRAAINAHPEMVEVLLKSGADVNATTAKGETALHLATAIKGQKGVPPEMAATFQKVIELLKKSGAKE